jgi:hypothetical protein
MFIKLKGINKFLCVTILRTRPTHIAGIHVHLPCSLVTETQHTPFSLKWAPANNYDTCKCRFTGYNDISKCQTESRRRTSRTHSHCGLVHCTRYGRWGICWCFVVNELVIFTLVFSMILSKVIVPYTLHYIRSVILLYFSKTLVGYT